jgi:hypothetical protein
VQASLVKLYRAWPKLRLDGGPDAYLGRIMVNTHRSWWRARWRHETPAGELPEIVIADFADGQALAAQVRQALQALPRQQRAVLVLRYYSTGSPRRGGGTGRDGPGGAPGQRAGDRSERGRGRTRGQRDRGHRGRGHGDPGQFPGPPRTLVMTQVLTFSNFGAPVTVTPPPADQTYSGP